MAGNDKGNRRPIVVRREEVIEGGHHGGAWKVAYADFVTAMMAFFLLMWLLNATTEAQRKGLADYFTPTNAMSHNSSGSGKPFGGHTPFDDGHEISDKGAQAAMVGRAPVPPEPDTPDVADGTAESRRAGDEDGGVGPSGQAARAGEGASGGGQASAASRAPVHADYLAQAGSGSASRPDARAGDPALLADAALRAELERRERADFEQASNAIRQALASDPALADVARQVSIDMTPQGLRIQLLDADRTPMFASGSSVLADRARQLIGRVAPVLARMSESISVSGHTDAAPYKSGGKTNWELSSERANATLRVLTDDGLDAGRFRSVSGNADREPLLPDQPMAAANRRIAIVMLRTIQPTSPAPPGTASAGSSVTAPAASAEH